MKVLSVTVVGSVCIVTDEDKKTVLEVVGDKVYWAQDVNLGNSDREFVQSYNANK